MTLDTFTADGGGAGTTGAPQTGTPAQGAAPAPRPATAVAGTVTFAPNIVATNATASNVGNQVATMNVDLATAGLTAADVVDYSVSCTPGAGVTNPVAKSNMPLNLTGLTNGTQYSCTVVANLVDGRSTIAGQPAVFTPMAPVTNATPSNVGETTATVNLDLPGAGVDPANVTNYTFTCTPDAGNQTSPVSVTQLPLQLSGLTPDTAYSCTGVANMVGGGSSVAGTPAAFTTTTQAAVPPVAVPTLGHAALLLLGALLGGLGFVRGRRQKG